MASEEKWQVRPPSKGMLHERRQDQEALKYRTMTGVHYSEAFIRQTFVNKPFKTRMFHAADPGLKAKQSRGGAASLLAGLAGLCCLVFAAGVRVFSTIFGCLLPRDLARTTSILATACATAFICTILAGEALREVPLVFSAAAHTLHCRAVLHELHAFI